MKKLFLLFFIIIILAGCAGFECYRMGDRFDNLTICPFSNSALQAELKRYILVGAERTPRGNEGRLVDGFYVPKEHKIYCIKNFDILLHELWHASGNMEEPYWERR